MGRGWWYKTLWETAPLKWHSLWERSNFPRIWFQDLWFRIWGLKINHLHEHDFVWQGCFFFHYYFATLLTNWAQIFKGFLISCICWDTPSGKTSFWQLQKVSSAFACKSVLLPLTKIWKTMVIYPAMYIRKFTMCSDMPVLYSMKYSYFFSQGLNIMQPVCSFLYTGLVSSGIQSQPSCDEGASCTPEPRPHPLYPNR